MIFVKLISGLGNQLFQYVVGRQLSIERGVPLKLDTSFFEGQQLRSFKLNHYRINASMAAESEVSDFLKVYNSNSLYSKLYRKIERQFPKHRWRYYKEDQWWTYEPGLVKAASNIYLDGYWQHYKYFEKIDPSIFRELTLQEEYSSTVAKLVDELKQNNESVSIHIRRGDYVTDPDAYQLMGLLPVEYYSSAVNYFIKKFANPAFYVFSDDPDWVKDNLSIQAPVNFIELENGSKDYIELDLMSKCSHHIIANSSFSWWGAFLNRKPGKTVIAPAKWVVPPEINKRIELQFPSWIKM